MLLTLEFLNDFNDSDGLLTSLKSARKHNLKRVGLSKLDRLKSAKTLSDFAQLVGFTPKGLSFVLYKLEENKKYREFTIPKKSGGTRNIKAPEKSLSLLQKRLADLLYECVSEIKKKNKKYWLASHGFQKKKTIVSNAEIHRRRRFLFNIDLADFFDAINFGRVRGFFIKDTNFSLEPSIATIIAQIACHENSLPQGSPCSPVISNLVGNLVDVRLLALARDVKCTYTRYADDLTFSTNTKEFPSEIAVNVEGSVWEVGARLKKEIDRAGFKVNPRKTRMSLRQSRQTVTGLVVNSKVNISQDYYRLVRAMCHSLFRTGSYYRPNEEEKTDNTNPIEGMLSHIYFVKSRRDRSQKVNRLAIKAREFYPPDAPVDLYRKLLFYKHFVAPKKPIILTEGVSDIVYLQCAIKALHQNFPALGEERDGVFTRLVSFLKPSGTTRDILNLGHGAAGQASLVSQYSSNLKNYLHKPMQYPVIILCDNDAGPKTVFKNAKSKSGIEISTVTVEPFYHLGENMYLVKVPEGEPVIHREIESLFEAELLATLIDGKPFDPKKDHGDASAYGKVVFAEKVVRANALSINFDGFADLLFRIEQCVIHHSSITQTVSNDQLAEVSEG